MSKDIERALSTLLPPYYQPSHHTTQLLSLATSLLAQSRTQIITLKPDEEIARPYLCAHLACDRLKASLNLPKISPKPPVPPKVYTKLLDIFKSALVLVPGTPKRNREPSRKLVEAVGSSQHAVTPTKNRRDGRLEGRQGVVKTEKGSVKRSASQDVGGDERRIRYSTNSRNPYSKAGENDRIAAWLVKAVSHLCEALGTTDDLAISQPQPAGRDPGGDPRVRRMQGAGNIKCWVEDALPAYMTDLADIASSAPTAAGRGREAVHMLCTRLDNLFIESYNAVNPDRDPRAQPVSDPMANPNAASERRPRPPCWFDAELRNSTHAATAATRRDPTSAEARQHRRDYQWLLQRKQRGFKRAQAAAFVQAATSMGKDFWRRFKPKQQIESSISKSQWFSQFSALLGEAPSEGSSGPGDVHAPRAADGSELNQPFTAARDC